MTMGVVMLTIYSPCPACSSTQVSMAPRARRLPARAEPLRCDVCGAVWVVQPRGSGRTRRIVFRQSGSVPGPVPVVRSRFTRAS